jgi:hypothetical protein
MKARVAQDRVVLQAEPDARSRVLASLYATTEIDAGVKIQHAGADWIEVRTPVGLGYIRADTKLEHVAESPGIRGEHTPTRIGTRKRWIASTPDPDRQWAISALIAFGITAFVGIAPVALFSRVGGQIFPSSWFRLALSFLIAFLFALLGRRLALGKGGNTLALHVSIIGGENPLVSGGYVSPAGVAEVYMARKLNRCLPLVGFVGGFLLGRITGLVWVVMYSRGRRR